MIPGIPSIIQSRGQFVPYRQKGTLAGTTSLTTQVVSFNSAPLSGNLLIVFANSDFVLDAPTTGGVWTQDATITNNTDTKVYSKISNGTETSVSLTAGGNAFIGCAVIYEFPGKTAADQSATTQVGSGVLTCGVIGPTGVTTSANEVEFGVCAFSSANAATDPGPLLSWDSGVIDDTYLLAHNTANNGYVSMDVGYRVVTVTGAFGPTPVWTRPTPALSTSNFIAITYK